MNACIGIISWLPDINSVRLIRLKRLQNLINQCNHLMNLPIIIIAQNGREGEITLPNNVTPFYFKKLGITGARKRLRETFIDSEYDKLIMLDDDMELYNNKQNFKTYLEIVEKYPAVEYKNFLCNLFAISKDLISQLDYDDIEAEKGEGYEDWIGISKLKIKNPRKIATIVGINLIPYNRHQLVNDPYSTGKTSTTEDLTEKSREIINAAK